MNFKQIATTYLVPAVALLLLATFFFYPQLQNKAIPQSDISAFKGMYHELSEHHKATGETSWWTNSMFGGMPAYQINSTQPTNLLAYVDRAMHAFVARPIGLFFLVMLCGYLSLLFFGASPWVSFFGAAVIGLSVSNFILFESGHMTKFKAIGYCIPMFMGLYIAYEKNRWAGISLYGISLGLALLCNHPQMLYYMLFSLLVFGAIAFVDAIRKQNLPSFGITTAGIIVVSFIALASSASKILPTLEYTEDTMRGNPILTSSAVGADSKSSEVKGLDWTYATNWSNGWLDVVAGFIPRAAGGGSAERAPSGSQTVANLKKKGARVPDDMQLPLYWGSMGSTGGAFYFGAVLFFLIMVQFLIGNKKISIWLGVSLLIMMMISMGRNLEWFNRILFDHLPYFNKFRTPNSISSVMAAIIGLGAAFGLHHVVTTDLKKEILKRKIIYAAAPLLLIALFFALLGPAFFDFTHPSDARYAAQLDTSDLIADRKLAMRMDALRSFVFVLLAATATYVHAIGKFNKLILIGILTALALFDMTGVGHRYLSLDEFKPVRNLNKAFAKRPVDEQILNVEKNRGAYRVYDMSVNTFNSAQTSYWHNTVGGYHPAKLQRFEDIKNYHLYKGNQAVLNMLNAKYIITQDAKLQQNPGALGPAWFVREINTVSTNDEEIQALTGFNPANTAVIHNEFSPQISGLNPSGAGTIQLTSYAPNKLTYQSNTASEELAVFSEVWYGPNKGWMATIDGSPVEILRVNYLLRALKVPAGNHEIVFTFDPSSQKTGNLITLISSFLLIALAGYLIFLYFKKQSKVTASSSVPVAVKTKKAKRKK
jgi:hypothetical protein